MFSFAQYFLIHMKSIFNERKGFKFSLIYNCIQALFRKIVYLNIDKNYFLMYKHFDLKEMKVLMILMEIL